MELDPSIFGQRQLSLRASMAKDDLSAMILFGSSSYAGLGTTTSGNVRYLTGWTSRFAASLLILPEDGAATLLVPGAHDALYVAEAYPWIERCLAESPHNYGKVARQMLLQMGAERIGIAGLSEMPQPVYQDLAGGERKLNFVPTDHLLDTVRVIKDAAEIENHRQACRISDQMLTVLFDRLRSFRGPTWKLMVEVEYAGRSLGAELATCWLAIGNPPDRPRDRFAENEREVRDGDQVLIGTWVTYQGYWGHCLRMGSVGTPSAEYRRLYEVALGQHRAAAAQVRSGVPAIRIQDEGIRFAEKSLPGSVDYPARFRYAHYLGLDYGESPSAAAIPQPDNWSQLPIPPAGEVILRQGMVLEVHTNLGFKDFGFGTIGDVYLVKDGKPERLTAFPQDIVVA